MFPTVMKHPRRIEILAFFVVITLGIHPALGAASDPETVHSEAILALQNEDPSDDKQAVETITRLAKEGLDSAQYDLGLLHVNGKVVEQDLTAAAAWWELAAAQGHMNAQYKLAHSYRTGRGVVPDPEKAFHWYLKAAEQGDLDASYNVATCYLMGQGVGRDLSASALWYERAAAGGNLQAYASLAQLYSMDSFSNHNFETSYMWLTLVLPYGHYYGPGAKAEMEGMSRLLESKLSGEQMNRAKESATAWKKEHPDIKGPDTHFEVQTAAPASGEQNEQGSRHLTSQ